LGEAGNDSSGVLSRVDGLGGWISAGTESSGFVPLASMARVFDSRNAIGVSTKTPLPSAKEFVVPALGIGGLPSTNVSALLLDISVHDQDDYTRVKLWADGTPQPSLQGLVHNKKGVEPLGNSAVVPVGANGKIRLWHAAGEAHIVVDVHGYFTKSATISTAGGFVPVTQSRLVDTRKDIGTTGGAIPANGNRTVTLTGSGIPSGTGTVFASVALFSPTDDGFLRLSPGSGVTTGTGGPDVSFPKRTFAAGSMIKLSGNKVTINNHSAAAVQVAIDVQGYFSQNAAVGGGYHFADARVLDTRTATTRLAGNKTIEFDVGGVGGVPATGVTAAALNIHTYKSGQEGNSLTVWPTGAATPAGVAHYQPGNNAATGSINRASLAIIPTGTDGKISLRNNSDTETDVYIELEGWFQDQAGAGSAKSQAADSTLVENFSYPGASAIKSKRNIELISGDGRITLSDDCSGSASRIMVETFLAGGEGQYCFAVQGDTGYLKVNVPNVYLVWSGDEPLKAKYTVGGVAESVDLNANDVATIGANTPDASVLLELRAG
jgi:hypothetical protein